MCAVCYFFITKVALSPLPAQPPAYTIVQNSVYHEGSGLYLKTWIIDSKGDTLYGHALNQGTTKPVDALNEYNLAELKIFDLCKCEDYYIKGSHNRTIQQK
jgi:hypothetical protein